MDQNEIYRMRKEFFNNHAEMWMDMWYKDPATGRHDAYAEQFARLFSMVELKPGDNVLDTGCGVGVLVPFILDRITDTGLLYEVDYAAKMIEVNRRRHPQPNIRFLVADVADMPVKEGGCDVAFCFSCFPHFHDKAAALTALAAALRKGGTLAIAHFDSSEGINKHHSGCMAVMHDTLPTGGEMRSLCSEAGFIIETFIDEPGFYALIADKA